ncbi:hypothetical protein BT69DRAFT_1380238 [Atractiella rhizophila]|nr:hypothetical protein BT69DRAFT_1380238 [Atractiella rhizophila]
MHAWFARREKCGVMVSNRFVYPNGLLQGTCTRSAHLHQLLPEEINCTWPEVHNRAEIEEMEKIIALEHKIAQLETKADTNLSIIERLQLQRQTTQNSTSAQVSTLQGSSKLRSSGPSASSSSGASHGLRVEGRAVVVETDEELVNSLFHLLGLPPTALNTTTGMQGKDERKKK